MIRALARQQNRVRKLLARLPLGGEAVWPGERSDLFAAHESVYYFAQQFARGRRIVDAACGTGYGSALLASRARSVLGIDQSKARVRFAQRTFKRANLEFRVGDIECFDFGSDHFDLCVCSNTLEHLESPQAFLRAVKAGLGPRGLVLVVVPPVYSEDDNKRCLANKFHVTSRSVRGWFELFQTEGWQVEPYLHRCERDLDFSSPLATQTVPSDFSFVAASLSDLYSTPALSATFLLTSPNL